jgi:hypothetical protein
MSNDASKMQSGLFNEICKILLTEWDPIGVGASPEAVHEYDGYVSKLLDMIRHKKTEEDIFAYLWWAETENMGLNGEHQKTQEIAHRLAKLSASPSSSHVKK